MTEPGHPHIRCRTFVSGPTRLTVSWRIAPVIMPVPLAAHDADRDLAAACLVNLGLPNIDHVLENVIHATDSHAVPQNDVVLEPAVDSFDYAPCPSALA